MGKTRNLCAVPDCRNTYMNTANSGISFHRIPPYRLREWAAAIGMDHRFLKENHKICSAHFLESDFKPDSSTDPSGLPQRRRLKLEAVPSQRLPRAVFRRTEPPRPQPSLAALNESQLLAKLSQLSPIELLNLREAQAMFKFPSQAQDAQAHAQAQANGFSRRNLPWYSKPCSSSSSPKPSLTVTKATIPPAQAQPKEAPAPPREFSIRDLSIRHGEVEISPVPPKGTVPPKKKPLSLTPPVRDTLRLHGDTATVLSGSAPVRDVKESALSLRARHKPCQLFWVKRIEGLGATYAEDGAPSEAALPPRMEPVGPRVSCAGALQSIASALHMDDALEVVGQREEAVFVNPSQPLVKNGAVSKEDLQAQEERVLRLREKLQKAMEAL